MKNLLLCAALTASLAGSALADDGIPAGYQAFESCVQNALKGRIKDVLKLAPLDQMRKDTLDEVEKKCEPLLPTDAQSQKDMIERMVVVMTAPVPQSGVDKGPVAASAGVIVQTKTGASLVLSADAALMLPKNSISSLTEGTQLRLSGNIAVGTTATGQSVIPNAHLTLEAGRALDAKVDESQKAQLEQLQINTAGFNAAQVREIIRLTFDRSLAMDRPWDISGGYGRELSISGPLHGVALRAVVEGGAGGSGTKTLPYLRLMVGADGYICKPISGEKHLVCASANIATGAGPVQARFDIGVGADYRYVASDRNDTKAWLHTVSVGPSFQESLQADLAGGHAASQGVFALTIQ